MEKLMLSEIAGALGAKCPAEKEIKVISTDTRDLPEGSLFVAVRGDRFDGHDFIPKAIETGAAAALSEKEIDGCPCVVVENTRKAYLDLAGWYRRKFSPALVGVTGSVGKTTTKEMIALVLSENFRCLKTMGNLNNEIGLPKTLFTMDSSHEAAVIEMGMSDFGEISRLSRAAKPTIGVITNIGFSHIENLKTQEGILKAKLEILDGMNEDSPLVVNGDDKHLCGLKKTMERPVYFFGIENEKCDVRGMNITENDGSVAFDICFEGKTCKAELPCVGRHNVLNALAAFCIGRILGMPENDIISALKKYKPDAMRQNIVKRGGVTVITDCYNASPDSMKASLGVLSDMKASGRKIAVLGDMLELGDESEKLHTMVGEYVRSAKIDLLYCYGNDSEFIIKESNTMAAFFHKEDKNLCAKIIKKQLKDGDVILFKGSRGMKLEEIIDMIFDDDNQSDQINLR